MRRSFPFLLFFIIYAMPGVQIYSLENPQIFLHEDFKTLERWTHTVFPKISKHTKYSISRDQERSILRVYTDASASGLLLDSVFNVYDYPLLSWRWKTDNVYSKEGDDYPLRIYVMFEFEPDKAPFFEKLKYNTYKIIYGRFPPHSSLNYIWASMEDTPGIISSPYTDKVFMITLRRSNREAGLWVEENVDIISDYISAFGQKPPARASIGIMGDSDNTGESASAYIDYIEIKRQQIKNE